MTMTVLMLEATGREALSKAMSLSTQFTYSLSYHLGAKQKETGRHVSSHRTSRNHSGLLVSTLVPGGLPQSTMYP